MTDWSRRALLRSAGVAVPALMAGCGGSDEGTPTTTGPDPDEGRESYGVLARNVTDKDHRLKVTASLAWEDETVFDETVDLAAGDRQSWDTVVKQPKEHAITAEIDEAIDGEIESRGKRDLYRTNMWLTPGGDNAPEVANVVVRIDSVQTEDEGVIPIVEMTAGEQDRQTGQG